MKNNKSLENSINFFNEHIGVPRILVRGNRLWMAFAGGPGGGSPPDGDKLLKNFQWKVLKKMKILLNFEIF